MPTSINNPRDLFQKWTAYVNDMQIRYFRLCKEFDTSHNKLFFTTKHPISDELADLVNYFQTVHYKLPDVIIHRKHSSIGIVNWTIQFKNYPAYYEFIHMDSLETVLMLNEYVRSKPIIKKEVTVKTSVVNPFRILIALFICIGVLSVVQTILTVTR